MAEGNALQGIDAPLSPAQRVQRFRQRKRQGLLRVAIEVRQGERASLVKLNLLAPDRVDDRQAVREAIHRFLERHFPEHTPAQ